MKKHLKPAVNTGLLLFLFLAAVLAAAWLARHADRQMREDLLVQTRLLAEVVNVEDIKTLSGTDADLNSPVYLRLKEQFAAVRAANPKYRFVYLMGQQADGTVFFFVDESPPGHPEEAPAGMIYEEVPEGFQRVFETGIGTVEGPFTDQWGSFVSGCTPLIDLESGEIAAALAIDFDAARWKQVVAARSVLPAGLTFLGLAVLVVVGSGLLARRARREGSPLGWQEYLEPILTLAGGLILSLFIAWVVRSNRQWNQRGLFRQFAESRTAELVEAFRDLQEIELEGLARFYEGSENVTPEEFQQYAQHLLKNRAVQAWGWIPVVSALEKESFEQAARGSGMKDFKIWQRDTESNRVPAEGRAVYYPVCRSIPEKISRLAMGFDMGSESVRHTAIDAALRTGLHTATDPVKLITESGDQKGILCFRPVFADAQHRDLRGLAFAVLRLGDALDAAVPDHTIEKELFLAHDDKPPQLLASTLDGENSTSTGLVFSRPILTFGKTFIINTRSGADFQGLKPEIAGLSTLLTGLLLSAAAAVVLSMLLRRRQVLEGLVQERTKKLRESERQLSLFFSQSLHGFFMCMLDEPIAWNEEGADKDHLLEYVLDHQRMTRVNQALLDQYGAKKSDFVGITVRELFRQDLDYAKELWRGLFDRGTWHKETSEQKMDGTPVVFDGDYICLYDEQGCITGHFGVQVDITERKRFEKMNQSLLNIINVSKDFIGIAGSGKDAFFVNAAGQAMVGLDGDDAVRETNIDEYFLEEDLPYFKEIILPALFSEGRWSGEFRFRHFKTGRAIPVLYDLFLTEDPETGQLTNITTISRDITERKKAEADLQRLSTAIEQSPEAVVITDTEGIIQYVNPVFIAITGYSREEAIGQNPRILKSGHQDTGFYTVMWNTLLEGRSWEGRMINKRKDGSRYTEEASIAPVKDSKGTITNYVGIKRDITAELEREEMFRQSQKMESVGQLASGIAHDFNNMLQAILGFNQLLMETLPDTSRNYQRAKEVEKAAKCAVELTRALLAFSRKQPIDKKEINLNDTVRENEALLRTLLGKNNKIDLQLSDNLHPVCADPGQLTQIIMNLAVNARDAMPDGGRLTITTDHVILSNEDVATNPDVSAGGFICLAVTDTGCGMSKQVQDHLFEPFFTTKEVGKGTGLGMAVIYGIVKQNNGWIHVYSEEGQGTSIKVYLPAIGGNQAAHDEEIPDACKGARILLVEDDLDACRTVVRMLKTAGCHVTAVASAEDALTCYTESSGAFDLLFSDIGLPGKTGLELADELKSRQPGLPILLYSGYCDPRERWGNLDSKGYRFLRKPFTFAALLAALCNALEG